jgi:hypothetical protein
MKKNLVGAVALIVITAFSGTGAQAATTPTATAGGLCAKAGSTTSIAGKPFTCIKALTGKLVWMATTTVPSIGGTKPSISGGGGGREGGNEGPGDDNGGGGDSARTTGFKKYNACLVAHGGTAIAGPAGFRGKREPKGSGVATLNPPAPQPTVSAAQTKAIAACAALAPKFRPRGDN